MQFRIRRPVRALARFVDVLWAWECFEQPHRLERLLPDGSMQLVINLAEDESRIYDPEDHTRCRRMPGSILAGAHSRHFVIDTVEQRDVAGIVFRPGAARAFFGLPADQVRNQQVPLEVLWGRALAAELRERLLGARSPDARIDVMEEVLLARCRGDAAAHPAVRFALRKWSCGTDWPRVDGVSREIGLSSRRFIELFRAEVGLTPKIYCRIHRFRKALRHIQGGREFAWADLALACGYFDQAHFIHDFREFSGIRPTDYAAAGARQLSHVPV